MGNTKVKKNLLQRKEVIEEINRHLWLESEKAGYDIGFEKAAEDWLARFSAAWMDYHMPQQKSAPQRTPAKKPRRRSETSGQRRSAKSYR